MITCRNRRSGPMVPEDCPATSPVGIREEVHTPVLLVYVDGAGVGRLLCYKIRWKIEWIKSRNEKIINRDLCVHAE